MAPDRRAVIEAAVAALDAEAAAMLQPDYWTHLDRLTDAAWADAVALAAAVTEETRRRWMRALPESSWNMMGMRRAVAVRDPSPIKTARALGLAAKLARLRRAHGPDAFEAAAAFTNWIGSASVDRLAAKNPAIAIIVMMMRHGVQTQIDAMLDPEAAERFFAPMAMANAAPGLAAVLQHREAERARYARTAKDREVADRKKAALMEFDRTKAANPTLSDSAAAAIVARRTPGSRRTPEGQAESVDTSTVRRWVRERREAAHRG